MIIFCVNGDLSGFIKAHEKFNKPVREEEVWNILLQSMKALEYIHSQNVIHRDIKPANLFMTNNKTIKVGDFGVAAKMPGLKSSVNNAAFSGTVVGSPMFMSPEMLKEEDYDSAANDNLTWNEYKLANAEPVVQTVPDEVIDVVSKATGIGTDNVAMAAYTEYVFFDRTGANITVTDILQIVMILDRKSVV